MLAGDNKHAICFPKSAIKTIIGNVADTVF
jgi:hypothetical protein